MKITKLVRPVVIASATTTSSTLTVVTSGIHNLVNGDIVTFDTHAKLTYTVTVVNATTFTVPAIYRSISTNPHIPTFLVYSLELNAAAGSSIPFALGSTNDSMATFQVIGKTSIGTGSATVNIEVSNNAINWLTYGTITLTLGTTEVNDGLVITAPWAYIKATAKSVTGTNGKVSVLMGRSS